MQHLCRIKNLIGLIAFTALLFIFCGKSGTDKSSSEQLAPLRPPGEYRKISAKEAKKILDGNPAAILLDVRSEEEYKAGHIAGAFLIPAGELETKAAHTLPDKNALILVYCRRGIRSKAAAGILLSKGYANIYDIGGISDWSYGTVKD